MEVRLQTEIEFASKVAKLRAEFQGTWESAREIYILKINPEVFSNESAKAKRTFPSNKYPTLVENPLGFVYVGLTGLTAERRFEVHRDKLPKASKIAKLGFLLDGTYQEVGQDLIDKFGFKQVGWRNKIPEKLESWVAWNFYKMGYWVWGSHHHNDEDFLDLEPFY
jgi:hypothetical protein